jgi:hypothetical protein
MPEYTDNELIKIFRTTEGRHYAFNLLAKRHQEKVYYFVRRLVVDHDDADDVVQNVFIKVRPPRLSQTKLRLFRKSTSDLYLGNRVPFGLTKHKVV